MADRFLIGWCRSGNRRGLPVAMTPVPPLLGSGLVVGTSALWPVGFIDHGGSAAYASIYVMMKCNMP
jgi:hypothetical protein